jgi:chromosome partitioning protein
MKTVGVLNFKGGVGKTATAVNLAAAAYEAGRRVLLVDLEPQASATEHVTDDAFEHDASDVLDGRGSLRDAIYTVRPLDGRPAGGQGAASSGARLDLLPGGDGLIGLEIQLQSSGAKNRLAAALGKPRGGAVADDYDLVVVDSSPDIGLLSLNALYASDVVLCPVKLESPSIHGLRRLTEVLERAALEDDHEPRLLLLPTVYDGRVRESAEVLAALEEAFGRFPEGKVLPPVRYSSAFPRAFGRARTVFEHERETKQRGRAAEDYRTLFGTLAEVMRLGAPTELGA